jgi:hypothetical protein
MKHSIPIVLALSAASLLAQDGDASKPVKGQVMVQGCVSRFNGDFILVKQSPAMTYELHSAGKVKLAHYLGQRVEVTGTTSPSLSTSSDALGRGGAPSPITLTATSIKTITKECTEPMVPDK